MSGVHVHLEVRVQPGWRVYAAAPPEAEQKAAGFSAGYPPVLESEGGADLHPLWPRPELWTRQDGPETLSSWVYQSSFDLPVQTRSLTRGLQGNLRVLACSDTLCVPLELPFFLPPEAGPDEESAAPFPWWMLGMAFLGGLVLHLMPCVLPVLGLKLAQMVHAAPSQNRAWNRGAFLGVMTLFSSAGVLWGALKWGGSTLGWGFHFQNPWFVLVLFVGLLALWTHGMGWWTWKTPAWATYKTFSLQQKNIQEQFVPWVAFMTQLGAEYEDRKDFKKKLKAAFRKIQVVYPDLQIEYQDGGLVIRQGKPAVSHQKSQRKLPSKTEK
jgi:hypothetical protein